MPDILNPKIQEQEQNFETRDIVVAGLEEPKGKFDESVPIINMFKLQQFFNISQPKFAETEVLNQIYNYFEKKGAQSMNEVFIEILDIEHKLGATPLGQTRLNHLWNYLKILSQISQYDQLRQGYERN